MKSIILVTGIILFNILFVWNCSDDDIGQTQDCKNKLIQHFEMQVYQNEEIGCRSFISLIEFENEYYAYLDNYCADFESYTLVSCDGNTLCTTKEQNCFEIIDQSANLGIIGITPE